MGLRVLNAAERHKCSIVWGALGILRDPLVLYGGILGGPWVPSVTFLRGGGRWSSLRVLGSLLVRWMAAFGVLRGSCPPPQGKNHARAIGCPSSGRGGHEHFILASSCNEVIDCKRWC